MAAVTVADPFYDGKTALTGVEERKRRRLREGKKLAIVISRKEKWISGKESLLQGSAAM